MILQLRPCYEGESYPGRHTPFHFLDGSMPPEALSAFLIALFDYGKEHDEETPATLPAIAAGLLAREEQILPGGLILLKGDYMIEPSCCCGLESWREWYWALEGEGTPWLGHDPSPGVEPLPSGLLLHTDMDNEAEDETLPITYDELAAALERAEETFSEFALRLDAWLTEVSGAEGQALAVKICDWFRIGPDHA